MSKTIKVTTAWIWVGTWFAYDIIAAAIMGDEPHFKQKIMEDSAIAFFILGLWLMSSLTEWMDSRRPPDQLPKAEGK